VLLLLYLKSGDSHDVIAPQSKLHGFLQSDMSLGRSLIGLRGKNESAGQCQSNNKVHFSFHDLASLTCIVRFMVSPPWPAELC
jgi:hypothetical protein